MRDVDVGNHDVAEPAIPKLIPDADPIAMSLMPNGKPDNKWVIEATGNYELIVNPAKMTIALKKL